ncbi:MAG: biotin--[acetyl-CoA-carboxylase] ligase [Gemmatimonadota bacterium]|nr:biotin--[acetyl-CoA-carboxylase] ligase [Gemmatimonadota bacterium]
MSFADTRSARIDGATAVDLARRLALPRVELFQEVGSTLDVAHAIAPDAPSGTLIVADEQTAGRARHGRRWASAPGAGLWLTLIERPMDARSLDVLSLRCGLYAAESLDALAGDRVGVKWPNDLYVGERKLAGILIETRWRGTAPDWVAIGFGLNVIAPDVRTGIGLALGVTRLQALDCVVPALRAAAIATRHLGADELGRWRERDIARDRVVTSPAAGTVMGISADGELLVAGADGRITSHRTGSLTFAAPLACS